MKITAQDITDAFSKYISHNKQAHKRKVLIRELKIPGSRADFAVLSPLRFVGYEIKSRQDDKTKLIDQLKCYMKIFDYTYAILSENSQIDRINSECERVGIITYSIGKLGGIKFRTKKKAVKNEDAECLHLLNWPQIKIMLKRFTSARISRYVDIYDEVNTSYVPQQKRLQVIYWILRKIGISINVDPTYECILCRKRRAYHIKNELSFLCINCGARFTEEEKEVGY